MKSAAKRFLARAGYHVTRGPSRHRFDATEDVFRLLRGGGYRPRVVIDAGANVGAWTRAARRYFPEAAYHLIEPQPACAARLTAAASARDRVHQVALVSPGIDRVQMVGGGSGGGGTGAYVSSAPGHADARAVPAATLDALLADHVAADDRALLKLDLEGHELEAMHGAAGTLQCVEVLIVEVQFFDINHEGRPLFTDIVHAAEHAGFRLYDLASMSARPRDGRLRLGDAVFVANGSPLAEDVRWE